MPPTERTPTWASPKDAIKAENAVDGLIVNYVKEATTPGLLHYEDLDEVAKQVMASLYSAIEAQVEIVVNRRAYSA